jgi:hypothetical protein
LQDDFLVKISIVLEGVMTGPKTALPLPADFADIGFDSGESLFVCIRYCVELNLSGIAQRAHGLIALDPQTALTTHYLHS